NDIGMVLHRGDYNFIPGADVFPAVGLRDQVDSLGRAAQKDDLARVAGVEKALDDEARVLIGFGAKLAQQMYAAMDIGIFGQIGMTDRIDDNLWLLGRGGIVEVYQGLAVNVLLENREVFPDLVNIDHGWGVVCSRLASRSSLEMHRGDYLAGCTHKSSLITRPPVIRANTASLTVSRIPGDLMPSRISLQNA